MSLMAVPTSRHGDSLPAELRVSDAVRHSQWMGRARLGVGLLGLTATRGMNGLGQCDPTADDYDPAACAAETSGPITSGVTDTSTPPVLVSSLLTGPLAPGEGYGPPPSGYTCPMDDNGNCTAPATSIAQVVAAAGLPTSIPGYSGPTSVAPGAVTPTPPAGYMWATLANQAGQTLAKVLAISQGGSTVTLPNGSQLIYGSAASAANAGSLLSTTGGLATLGSSGSLMLLLGGLLLFFLLEEHH